MSSNDEEKGERNNGKSGRQLMASGEGHVAMEEISRAKNAPQKTKGRENYQPISNQGCC